MFEQDDWAGRGLGQEPSRRSFVIYDKEKLSQVDENLRWSVDDQSPQWQCSELSQNRMLYQFPKHHYQ